MLLNQIPLTKTSRPFKTDLRSFSDQAEKQYSKLPVNKFHRNDYVLPEIFDGPKIWKKYLPRPFDQGQCGSCWAIATANCLAARFNLQSYGNYILDFSPALAIFCYLAQDQYFQNLEETKDETIKKKKEDEVVFASNLQNIGCGGNSLVDAWIFLNIHGTCLHDCVPSSFRDIFNLKDGVTQEAADGVQCYTITGKLEDMCVDGKTPMVRYACESFYYIAGTPEFGGSEADLRHNLFEFGPISSAMEIYDDFYTFDAKTDIYRWNGKGQRISGHAVLIVGWGIDKGQKFWWIQNSWSSKWGINGYFKMTRGENICRLEENAIAPIPDFGIVDVPNAYRFSMIVTDQQTKLLEQHRDPLFPYSFDQRTGVLHSVANAQKNKVFPALFNPELVPLTVKQWSNFYAGLPGFSRQEENSQQLHEIVVIVAIVALFVALATTEYLIKRTK